MKTETREYTVYDWEALPEDSKQKALENLRDINTMYNWWKIFTEEYRPKTMPDCIKVTDISFSGFYSQGDGASLCYAVDDEPAFIEWIASQLGGQLAKRFKKLVGVDAFCFPYCNDKPVSGYSNYTIYPPYGLEPDTNYRGENNKQYTERMVVCINDILKDFHNEWSRQLYKDLQSEYEYLTSDGTIIEAIEANNYMFTLAGDIA